MFVRKVSNGNWYVVCRGKKHTGRGVKGKSFKNWFLLKMGHHCCELLISKITFPNEFLGKKIRLKIEIIEEENTTTKNGKMKLIILKEFNDFLIQD